MKRKLLLLIPVVAALAVGVVGMSAFEAHIINVTAHIENALGVSTNAIAFGTVFPQESLTQPFSVSLSSSFIAQGRATDVEYVINQKLKPCPVTVGANAVKTPTDSTCVADNLSGVAGVDYPLEGATGYHYLSLCKFLSKESSAPNAVSEPSYFHAVNSVPAFCATPTPAPASGKFDVVANPQVTSNDWTVDLKVPPIVGTVGQDWPATCADYTIPTDSATYGCDLWVEVTGISTAGTERPTVGALLSSYVQPVGQACNVNVTDIVGDGEIQAGVNLATTGQTVCVGPGTYNENVVISTPGVTLAGNGATATSIINGRVRVAATGATVKGFRILGANVLSEGVNGIYVVGGSNNVTISNNAIDGVGQTSGQRIGVHFEVGGTTGVTVKNNVIENWGSTGLYLNPTAGPVSITYNDFLANNVGIGSSGPNNVTVTNNSFVGNIAEAIGIDDTSPVSGIAIHINNFTPAGAGNNVNAYGPTVTANATNNWWDSEVTSDRTNIPTQIDVTSPAVAAFPHN